MKKVYKTNGVVRKFEIYHKCSVHDLVNKIIDSRHHIIEMERDSPTKISFYLIPNTITVREFKNIINSEYKNFKKEL